MENSTLVDKLNPNMSHHIVETAKVSDSITFTKQCHINPLVSILPDHIINKIKAIPILIRDIKDKIKLNLHSFLSNLSATWTNNNNITPHPKTCFLNSIW